MPLEQGLLSVVSGNEISEGLGKEKMKNLLEKLFGYYPLNFIKYRFTDEYSSNSAISVKFFKFFNKTEGMLTLVGQVAVLKLGS